MSGPGGIACLHLADLGNLYPGLDIIGRCAVFLAAGNSNLTLGDLLRKLLLTPDLIGKCLTRDRNHDFLSLKQVQDGLECFPRNLNDFRARSEEHTSELQSLMRISYDVFCLIKKKYDNTR